MPAELSALSQSLDFHWFQSKILGRFLHLWVAKPLVDGLAATQHAFSILLVDADQFTPQALVSKILALQSEKALPPLLLVFLENPQSPCCPLYNRFLDAELWPWLREKYSATQDPRNISIAGCHDSAITALYAALRMPHMLRSIIGISPNLLWHPAHSPQPYWIRHSFSAMPTLPLCIGLYICQDAIACENSEWHAFSSLLSEKKYQFYSQIAHSCANDDMIYRSFLHGLQCLVR